jgi:excisionase family DNA binding protein
MDKSNVKSLRFEDLPEAMGQLIQRFDRIESILLNNLNKSEPEKKEEDELLTIAEAAIFTKYAEQTLRTKVMKGEVPSIRLNGKRLFRKSELIAWIKGEKI